MGTQFPDIVIGRGYPVLKAKLTSSCSDLFPFALVAVAAAEPAAEPQWYAQPWDATHMKTASGDTVSVAAHKAQHHQLKAAEYAKKGYAFGYVKPAVYAAPAVASYAAPVATYAHTYATGMPVLLESTILASVKPKLIPNTSTTLEFTPTDTTDMPSQRSTTPLLPQ